MKIEKEILMNSDYEEICIMMYSLSTLHCRGISVLETVRKALQNLFLWYEITKDTRYIDLIELHLQAYVNMGNALDPQDEIFAKALELLQKKEKDFQPGGLFMGKCIKLSKMQVRSMIGKWKPSKNNPMTVNEVVDDIIRKVSEHQKGDYIYQYQRSINGKTDLPEIYELIVRENESYFYDVNNFRFYKLCD